MKKSPRRIAGFTRRALRQANPTETRLKGMHVYEARFGLLFDFFLDIWCYGFLEEKEMEFIFLWNFWDFGEKIL